MVMMTCNKNEMINDLIEIGVRLRERNYSPGYSGNLSARFEDNIIITTSGSSNGYLKPSDFTLIDYSGNSVDGKKPSSEKKLHIQFYKMRSDINYIIHVHPAALCAFASAHQDLLAPVMAENIFYFGGIPLAEYELPSSDELVEKTSKYFNDYNAVLMANHGFVVGSSTLEDAYQKLELAEEYAKTVIYSKILGEPQLLSKEQTEKILNLR